MRIHLFNISSLVLLLPLGNRYRVCRELQVIFPKWQLEQDSLCNKGLLWFLISFGVNPFLLTVLTKALQDIAASFDLSSLPLPPTPRCYQGRLWGSLYTMPSGPCSVSICSASPSTHHLMAAATSQSLALYKFLRETCLFVYPTTNRPFHTQLYFFIRIL